MMRISPYPSRPLLCFTGKGTYASFYSRSLFLFSVCFNEDRTSTNSCPKKPTVSKLVKWRAQLQSALLEVCLGSKIRVTSSPVGLLRRQGRKQNTTDERQAKG